MAKKKSGSKSKSSRSKGSRSSKSTSSQSDIKPIQPVESMLDPFQDPRIIREIGKYLPYKYLVEGRQVNKKWCDEFTTKMKARIKSPENFVNFLLPLENKSLYASTKKITKIDISEWEELKNMDALAIESIFKRLSKTAICIKELKVSKFNMRAWPLIIRKVFSSLEVLDAELDLMNTNNSKKPRIFEVYEDEDEEEEEVPILKKLKKVKLIFSTDDGKKEDFNKNFLEDILKVCRLVNELEVKIDGSDSGAQCDFFLKKLTTMNMTKLKKLTIHCNSTQKVLMRLAKFSLKLKKEIQININHCVIPSKSFPGIFANLCQMSKYKKTSPEFYLKLLCFKKTEFGNVKIIGRSGLFSKWTLSEIFRIFPNVEEICYCDAGKTETSFKEISPYQEPKKGEFLKKLSYHFDEMQLGHSFYSQNISDKITELFPNLTKLVLTSSDISSTANFKLNGIYRELKKLEILHLDFPKLNINDEMIVGLTSKTKNGFPDRSYEYFCKLSAIWPLGIVELKELRELDLKIQRGITEISFIFGFGILPKLENFKFNTHSLNQFDKNHFQIFTDGFQKLETLSYDHSSKNNANDFKDLKIKRPFLKINYNGAKL